MNISSDAWHFAVNALQLLFPFPQCLHVKENDSSADLGSAENTDPSVFHRGSHPKKETFCGMLYFKAWYLTAKLMV